MTDRQKLSQRRRWLRRLMFTIQRLFLRTEIRGLENVPQDGPVLLLFNHLSTLDGPLVMANTPRELELVGPGDFPSMWLENITMTLYDMIRVNRGRPDRASLRQMAQHLKEGRALSMAPGGGTWEKRLTEAKPGAAYLSQLIGAPLMVVALGGLYEVPTFHVKYFFKRPRVTMTFSEVLPPVPRSKIRAERDTQLEEATYAIMQRLYELLPSADQARYDHWTRATYDLELTFATLEGDEPLVYDGPPLPDMSGLAEFLAKPNLFRPMWLNSRLNIEPLHEPRFFPPLEVQLAARDLHTHLTVGAYDVYLPYRLGDYKAQQAYAALRFIHDEVCEWAMSHEARIKIVPAIHDSLNLD
ncbi:lysophospholipid acyltransferase family protein [Chloroflexota bacterium]